MKFPLGAVFSVSVPTYAYSDKYGVLSDETLNSIELTVNDFEKYYERVEAIIDIQENGISVDVDKAYSLGFTEQEVRSLLETYEAINQEIKAGRMAVKPNQYGVLDICPNESQMQSMELGSGTTMGFGSQISYEPNTADVRTYWYGVDIYIPAKDCADIAALIAGGTATVGGIAGILGLYHLPGALVGIVSAWIMGLGSAYLWYCSNANGLDVSYNYIDGMIYPWNGLRCSRRD